MAYGLKKFTTSKQQEIEVSLHASSKQEFMEAMKEFDAARLHIKVADTKNAKEIRQADTTLRSINDQLKKAEQLKPKGCDCDCGLATDYPVAVKETK
jgi:pyridoxine 5'-phosphate synthase PdxJ